MARPAKLDRLRDRAMYSRTKAMRAFWKRSLERNRLRYVSQTVTFDGVPTMRGLAILLERARKQGWKGMLNSSDRREGVAERFGRSSQAALYKGWLARKPGFLPANPPGFSSHELRSDGSPLFGTRGQKLPWYQLGLDVSDDQRLVDILRGLGVGVVHPYRSPSEAHHINLTTDPMPVLVHLGAI